MSRPNRRIVIFFSPTPPNPPEFSWRHPARSSLFHIGLSRYQIARSLSDIAENDRFGGDEIILTESRSLILSQMCASKFSCFLMSDRLLARIIHECRRKTFETEARRDCSHARTTQAYWLQSVEEARQEPSCRARGSGLERTQHRNRVNVWSRWKRQPRADRLLSICV